PVIPRMSPTCRKSSGKITAANGHAPFSSQKLRRCAPSLLRSTCATTPETHFVSPMCRAACSKGMHAAEQERLQRMAAEKRNRTDHIRPPVENYARKSAARSNQSEQGNLLSFPKAEPKREISGIEARGGKSIRDERRAACQPPFSISGSP